MAYMSQEIKKQLEPAIKAVFKKYKIKATLGVENYSALIVNIKSGQMDFNLKELKFKKIHNKYAIENNYQGPARDFLLELEAAMAVGNHDNSDVMTDYFDVGWYTCINIGSWNRPYINTPQQQNN